MKMSVEEKRKKILAAFELLSEDFDEHWVALGDTIAKMAKIDPPLAVDMIKNLLGRYPAENHKDDFFSFTCFYALEQGIGNEQTFDLILHDSELKHAIFAESGYLHSCPLYMIHYYVVNGKTHVVDELMQLAWENKYRKKRQTNFEILTEVIPTYDCNMTNDMFDLLNSYVKRIRNKENRAVLDLRMLTFVEDD